MSRRNQPVHLVAPHGVGDPDEPSGGNTYDRRLVAGLVMLGWDARLHTTSPAGLAGVLDAFAPGSLVVIDGLLASDQPEVVVPRARRLRLVLLLHLPRGLGARPAGSHAAEGAVLAAAAAVVTPSLWSRRQVIAGYGVPADRVRAVPPGVDPKPLPPAAGDPRQLLVVAAVTEGKGHDVLVGALRHLDGLPWRVRCVGPLTRDPGFVCRLRADLSLAGLADRVLLEGPRSGPALDAAYAAAGLLVLPSRGETYGMVLTEALAHGVPVLASDVGGVTEAVGPRSGGRRAGLLVPAGDSGALAAALRRWWGDERLRAGVRAAALQRRATLPDWATTAARFSRVLEHGGLRDEVPA